MMDTLLQDLRYAARQLRRSPGFALVAVLTLALGIGASTTIFSVVNALLLHPLPFRDIDRLVYIRQTAPGCTDCQTSPGTFLSLRGGTATLDEVAAVDWWDATLRGPEQAEVVHGYRVTPNFFRMVGVPAALGRTFSTAEGGAGRERVAVLSHRLWERRFGADPRVLGQTVALNGDAYTVIGVLPDEYTFPSGAEIWTPLVLAPDEVNNRSWNRLDVFGRLAPGVPPEQARREVAALGQRLAAEYPESNANWRLELGPMRKYHYSDVAPFVALMVGAVGFVLLIVCANVGNLLLARATTRQREITIRSALGAGRWRIARQLLTESVLLALLGGGLGVLLALWAVPALRTSVPEQLSNFVPGWRRVGIDGWVLAFTLALSTLTGVVFGLVPAFRTSRPDLTEALREGGWGATGGKGNRTRRALVVSEFTLALVLLVGAALLARSFVNMQSGSPGFRSDPVLTLRLQLPAQHYAEDQIGDYYGRVVQRLEALPGIDAAGVVSNLPLSHSSSGQSFNVEGQPPLPPSQAPTARDQVITPAYFAALGIPLVRGRGFTEQDGADAPRVAVINQALEKRFFSNHDPVGQGLLIAGDRYQIVGVVGNVFHEGVNTEAGPEIYRAQRQVPQRSVALAVRTRNDPAGATRTVLNAIAALDPEVAITDVRPMDQLAAEFLSPFRLMAALLGAFAAIAFVISAIGIYGVISYVVAQRTREIGIRMALGANRDDVLRLIVGQGVRLAAAGIIIGLLVSLAVTRLTAFLLYGVSATDAPTLLVVAVALATTALLASYFPARRATRVDPMVALRAE